MSVLINLRPLREQKNLSQEALANELEVVQSYISGIENGKIIPSLPMAIKIADHFGVPLQALLNDNASLHGAVQS